MYQQVECLGFAFEDKWDNSTVFENYKVTLDNLRTRSKQIGCVYYSMMLI